MSAVFPISLRAILIFPSTDRQRHRIRVRRKLSKKAKVSSFSGGSFPYLLRGHTSGHLCFYSKPYLFCGDTLFSGGCGRLFEGMPEQMYQSLQKINALPADTVICCAHEYTLGNMKFAASVLPEDRAIQDYYLKVKELRAKTKNTPRNSEK